MSPTILIETKIKCKTDEEEFLYIKISNCKYCDKHETDLTMEYYVFCEVVDFRR